MSLSFSAFDALVRDLCRHNDLTRDLAAQLASFIGDTPELDENGLVVAKDAEGKEYRLRLPQGDEPGKH